MVKYVLAMVAIAFSFATYSFAEEATQQTQPQHQHKTAHASKKKVERKQPATGEVKAPCPGNTPEEKAKCESESKTQNK